jgi:DNA helicase-2/ATP-dependent DNA helicase PcrA
MATISALTPVAFREVLRLAAFIETKPSMQAVLVNKYPFLLIDESQDTNKGLLEAFFTLAAANAGKFAIGLFGDTMQRIFLDGHPNSNVWYPRNGPARQAAQSPLAAASDRTGNVLRSAIDRQTQLARTTVFPVSCAFSSPRAIWRTNQPSSIPFAQNGRTLR